MHTDTPLDRADTHLTPFVIGVSGHMKLPKEPERVEALRERFRDFYRWVLAEKTEKPKSSDGLGPGLGLKKTPIHVLSSMAPGVDQIAAEVAREAEFGFRVIAPLPFPEEQYLRSTTFSKASGSEKEALSTLPDMSFYVELASEVGIPNSVARLAREEYLAGDDKRTCDRCPTGEEKDKCDTCPVAAGKKAARYAHLRASGEYVASYCDVFLAVTNLTAVDLRPEPSSFDPSYQYASGTPSIVKARRHGITPGLLPVEPPLPWADVGPVVYLPWPKQGEPELSDEGKFSFYVEKSGDEREQDLEKKREAEREVVQEVAELIENFNHKAPSQRAAHAVAEMRSMFGLVEEKHKPVFEPKEPEPAMPAELRHRLLCIAGARRLAKNYNYARGDEVEALRARLLTLGLAAAVLLILYSDWVPAIDTVEWVKHSRRVAYIAALICALWTLIDLFRFRKGRVEGDQIDSRCVAEGLRVQFYWTAAGTGVSVASNYLLRQRGVIRWIVNAVSAASFPYEPTRKAFSKMALGDQCALLKKAVFGWIEAGGKKGQISFFKDKIDTIKIEQHHFQWQGWTWLFSGFVLSLILFLQPADWSTAGELLPAIPTEVRPEIGYMLIICGSVAFAGIAMYLANTDRGLHGAFSEPSPSSPLARWLQRRFHLRTAARSDWQSRILVCLKSLLYSLFVTSVIVIIAIGVVVTGWEFLPTGTKVLTIAKNILIALSARAFFSSSLRFHTENFRNYSAMLSQFESGLKQLQRHLATLKSRCDALPDDATTDPEAERTIAAIQALFLALGREALSEHAEWLHLRRDRPVSPNLPTP